MLLTIVLDAVGQTSFARVSLTSLNDPPSPPFSVISSKRKLAAATASTLHALASSWLCIRDQHELSEPPLVKTFVAG